MKTGFTFYWPSFDIRPHCRSTRTVQLYLPVGANVPSHKGTLAPPGEYDSTHASSARPSPKPKRQIDRFSRFCTAHVRKSLYFTIGVSLLQSLSMGESGPPHLTRDSFGPSEPTTQTVSSLVQPFLDMTAECPYILQWDASSPLKIATS